MLHWVLDSLQLHLSAASVPHMYQSNTGKGKVVTLVKLLNTETSDLQIEKDFFHFTILEPPPPTYLNKIWEKLH